MNSVTSDVNFIFLFSVLEKKTVDNDTPHPGPFLEFLKHRNYFGQNTPSFEHREEAGSILPLL